MNLNSPHPFIFEDGNILKAQSDEIAKETELGNKDEISFNGLFHDVRKCFVMSDSCLNLIKEAIFFMGMKGINLILVPFPVLEALKQTHSEYAFFCRTVYIVDRVKKTISIDKFCI
jgi:hypothetical protein